MSASHILVPPLCILVDFISSLLFVEFPLASLLRRMSWSLEGSLLLSPRYDDYLGRKRTTSVSPLINLFPINDHLMVVHG